jgi:hypothetical protein
MAFGEGKHEVGGGGGACALCTVQTPLPPGQADLPS